MGSGLREAMLAPMVDSALLNAGRSVFGRFEEEELRAA
jgi:hypothetical protein